MKFAKELEQDLVPEWRAMYLDYKQGKKKVKAVSRAASRANATPRTPAAPNLLPADPPRDTSLYGSTSPFGLRATPRSKRRDDGEDEPVDPLRKSPAPPGVDSRPDTEESTQGAAKKLTKTPPVPIPARPSISSPDTDTVQYGSFVPTPPKQKRRPQPFELPDPALPTETPLQSPSRAAVVPNKRPSSAHTDRVAAQRVQSMSIPTNAYEVGPTTPPPHRTTLTSLRSRDTSKRPFNVRRMFSIGTPLSSSEAGKLDMDMAVLDQVKMRQKEFFWWMDKELEKVETFYKQKEDEAGERLKVLREQLHVMRNRRIQEVAEGQRDKAIREQAERAIFDFGGKKTRKVADDDDRRPPSRDQVNAWLDPLERRWDEAKAKAFGPRLGQNSKALQDMQRSPELKTNQPPNRNGQIDEGRDYVRRPHHEQDVPYRTAKRKLKMALQEYYRSMELLKSYALLNRTAFRKINKKYDKAVDAHPPLRYMSEKVSKSWFVQSDVLDGHLHAVEDLYARYFERGNHKVATGKLRSSTGRPGDRSGSAFKNGLLIGTGAVFTIQGIIYGSQLLFHPDPTVRTQTSYLLQIYAGYFFGLYLLAWFCLDCSIWTRHKINYQFVFEFDPRNNLDWRQLAEFPSFFIFLFGLFIWINFSRYGTSEMYIYYPVILLFVTVLIVFMPAPIMYYKSRRWFVYSHWRLLLAGLYPVEFRDFFLGDMYCSLTYSMANIELFFCLYATYWGNPSQCNSTHSRLLGFFTTLPSIWRGLQCIRRYYDTRNAFPHLVNCGKYSMSIMYYMTLSLYRIHRSNNLLALFATFATINAIYSSIWDLFMDWSLLQPQAKKRFLRDVKGFKSTSWYYGAMILDPILRFNWIFYAIYTHDLQHNSIVSFLVGFSEITRRGIWTLFRVENEHCANVARFKASRDIPLPYEIDESSDEEFQRQQTALEREPTQGSPALTRTRSTTTGALEAQVSNTSSSLRRRPGIARTLTKLVADAHTQDFEKKRKPGGGESNKLLSRAEMSDDARDGSSDDDDEADEQDMLDAGELIRKANEDEHNGNGSPSTKRR